MNRKVLTLTLSLLLGLAAVAAVALGIAAPQRTAQAQSTLLLEENFAYGDTPGDLITVSVGNWTAHSGAGSGPVQYITASLVMPKYGSSGIGGSAVISTAGAEDVNRTFLTQTSGTIYYAALVKVITATSTGDYFLHLKDPSTLFRASIFVKDNSGAVQFGLGVTSSLSAYSSALFNYDTTYLVVAKYRNEATPSAALYVLTSPVPTEPAVPLLSATGGTTVSVRAIAIRQGTAGQRPAVIIDGIRVATTWEDAIGYSAVSAIKSVTPQIDVPYHGTVTYTIVLVNSRAVSDTVLFTDTLPAEVDFGQWLEQPEGATVDNDVITWSGTLTAGTAITFSFTAQHVGDYGDVVTNTAEFSGTEDAGTAQAVFNVQPFVLYDVALSKTAPTEPVVVRDGEGALVTYALTIENRSTITPVAPITLTEVLPEGFVYVSDDSGVAPTGSGSAADPLVWVFTDTLNPGASLSFNLVVSATDALTATGRYTNTAWVEVAGGDWIPENDTAQAGVTVYRVIPIAQARGLPTGTLVAIEGTVTAEPGIFKDSGQSRKLYMQDNTGGVLVYLSTGLNPVSRHNRVRVVGTMAEYRAETEIIPLSATDVVDLGPDTPVEPLPIATGAVDESVEGQLVRVAGYIVEKPNAYTLRVNDGSGSVDIYRYYNLGQTSDPNYIDFTPYVVGDYVMVTGTTRGYDYSGTIRREVLPRGPADVKELYPTTFVYHDLEDVVRAGEAVYLAGSFNGLSTTATPMNADDDFSVFSVTVTLENPGAYEYKYVVYTDTARSGPANQNWLQSANRSVTVNAPATVDDYRNIQPGYVVLQWPHATTTTVGVATENIYGRIWADDLTAREDAPRAILAQLGYGTDPNPANWTTWSPMTWNAQYGNDDEFMGVLTPTAAGVYSYVVRFNGNWGAGNPNNQWYYGDKDGVSPDNPFEIEKAGVLTVLAPGLNVFKSVAPDTDVPLGGVVTYTVVLSNSGAGNAIDVVLTDALPSEVTFGGWVQQPSGAVYENGVLTWTGTVTGNTEVTLVFTAVVAEDYGLYGRTVTNTARFTSDNAGSGQASAAFTVIGPPVLRVTKTVVPDADVRPGGVVTYTVVLSNSGAGEALGVVLTDVLPSEVIFSGWVQQSGAVYGNGVITWTGTVAGNAEVTLVFTATVAEDYGLYGRTVTNTARFTSDNAGSGQASAAFGVIGAPALTIAKSVVPDADVPLGGVVTYTVVLSNSGAGDAIGVVLTDVLPSEVTFGGWVQQPSGAIQSGGVITWTGTVAGNAEVTLVFTATLGSDPGLYNRTVANTASFVSTNAGSGSATVTFATERRYWIYLPLVMRNR